ncbi:tetratricopeptide repeat protein [Glycomyces sp. NPDC047369]
MPPFDNQFRDSVRNVIQGERIELFVGAPRPAPVQWPHRIGTVPPLAASRQERAADGRLAEADPACQVLSGMGGVGKTQLAAAYATRAWEAAELDLLVWVNASGREGIAAAFAQAGAELCGAEPDQGEQAAAAFLNFLSRPAAPRWLVVLDDLDEPASLQGLWPPSHPRGRTIVTTRRRDAALDGQGRTRLDIDLFSPEEALAYLHHRLGPRAERAAGAAALAERLGRLPLALAQAAAFIIDQPGLSCEDYLALLEDRTMALAELSPEAAPDGYRDLLGAAWSLSIEQADRQPPEGLGSGLLRIAAMLDPAGIPAPLFTAEPVLRYCSRGTEIRAHQVRTALGRLHRLSLVDSDGSLVRMHALVQRAVLDSTPEAEAEAAVLATARTLLAVWPDQDYGGSPAAPLWSAARMFREVLPDVRRLLGDDHPDTLAVRHALARWQGESGDVDAAVEGFASVLADRVRVLGPDHPDTLSTRQRLVYWQGERDDLAAAIEETDRLLADRIRVLGADHFDVLATRSLRARWLGRASAAREAARENEVLLADCLRLLEPDHPFTLAVRHNLAHWRGAAGDPAGAVEATEALLADRLRVLGPDHPDTLRSRQNLAMWRGEAGGPAAAVAELRSVLDDQLRVLGPDHPDTLAVRNDLARWTARTGEVDAALKEFGRLLADCDRLLAYGHRYRQVVAYNLDFWQRRKRAGEWHRPDFGGGSNVGIGSY